jgi:uncharacterized protein YicC (UPF0701 family)
LNPAALKQLADLASQVARNLPGAAPMSTADVLNWPGLSRHRARSRHFRTQVLAALAEALAALAESRRREGAALATVMLAQCEQIEHGRCTS